MEETRMIIDTDCGVDDALAIMLALKHPNCAVEAITCCHGNTTLSNVIGNVHRVLKVMGQTQIPVYGGCKNSLLGEELNADYHGSDGFGNVAHTIKVDDFVTKPQHASIALVDHVKRNPGKITLIAIGPLTNLAIAQRLDPSFGKNLKRLVIMGGNVEGMGNTSMAAEFNFMCDPEAAFVVLNEFKCPNMCIPWETCARTFIPWDSYSTLLSTDSDHARFIRDLTAHSVETLQQRLKVRGYRSCDLYAMACLVRPEVMEVVETFHATVELQGKYTRGQMVVERRSWITDKIPNLVVVRKIKEDVLLNVCKLIFQ